MKSITTDPHETLDGRLDQLRSQLEFMSIAMKNYARDDDGRTAGARFADGAGHALDTLFESVRDLQDGLPAPLRNWIPANDPDELFMEVMHYLKEAGQFTSAHTDQLYAILQESRVAVKKKRTTADPAFRSNEETQPGKSVKQESGKKAA